MTLRSSAQGDFPRRMNAVLVEGLPNTVPLATVIEKCRTDYAFCVSAHWDTAGAVIVCETTSDMEALLNDGPLRFSGQKYDLKPVPPCLVITGLPDSISDAKVLSKMEDDYGARVSVRRGSGQVEVEFPTVADAEAVLSDQHLRFGGKAYDVEVKDRPGLTLSPTKPSLKVWGDAASHPAVVWGSGGRAAVLCVDCTLQRGGGRVGTFTPPGPVGREPAGPCPGYPGRGVLERQILVHQTCVNLCLYHVS